MFGTKHSKQTDYKKPSSTKQANSAQNITIEICKQKYNQVMLLLAVLLLLVCTKLALNYIKQARCNQQESKITPFNFNKHLMISSYCTLPRAILANIFLVSHILLSPKGSITIYLISNLVAKYITITDSSLLTQKDIINNVNVLRTGC